MARPIVPADALEGHRVLDCDGVPLGTIADIVVDVERGVIACAVVSRGGELFSIPWQALVLDGRRGCLVLASRGADLRAWAGC